MSLAFYMDQHVPRAITLGRRLRGGDVLPAYEDGASELAEAALLDRASELGRGLFTRDDDWLAEAAKRQREGTPFHGLEAKGPPNPQEVDLAPKSSDIALNP